ncbi:MAG: hypothetical protein R2710_09705 [Acidimicrobiales bacterium]
MLSFIDGLGFDPFIRGLLSVMVGVVVLIGGTYLLVATNSGSRTGGLIAGAGLFGWMMLMGVFWTVYGIGWRGQPPTWELVEIVPENLDLAESERAQELGFALDEVSPADGVTSDDPDLAQAEAVAFVRDNEGEFADWRYLSTSDPTEARRRRSPVSISSSSRCTRVPVTTCAPVRRLQHRGKPLLDPDIDADDPDKNQWVETFTDAPKRALHKLDTMTLHAIHTEELMVIQVQGIVEQPTLPGQAPPVTEVDPEKPIYNVVMERDRAARCLGCFGGLRFTPAMFTLFSGLLFAVFCYALHVRDNHEAEIRANA